MLKSVAYLFPLLHVPNVSMHIIATLPNKEAWWDCTSDCVKVLFVLCCADAYITPSCRLLKHHKKCCDVSVTFATPAFMLTLHRYILNV